MKQDWRKIEDTYGYSVTVHTSEIDDFVDLEITNKEGQKSAMLLNGYEVNELIISLQKALAVLTIDKHQIHGTYITSGTYEIKQREYVK